MALARSHFLVGARFPPRENIDESDRFDESVLEEEPQWETRSQRDFLITFSTRHRGKI